MKYEIISEYEIKKPIELAQELADNDYLDFGAKVVEAHLECGTDLYCTFKDIDGALVEDCIPLSDIPDQTDYRACVGAVGEDGEEVVICIGY